MSKETANELFERLAAAFWVDTGVLAPGKDEPAGGEGAYTREEREYLFRGWLETRRRVHDEYSEGEDTVLG